MANNNYPQITSVTSEALQSQIRSLLPSQEGFGTDLMAQNVIVPIIDLTSAAEGSTVPQLLQTAYSFGSQTSTRVYNQTSTLINNTGFYRVSGQIASVSFSGVDGIAAINLTDGLTVKIIYKIEVIGTGANQDTTFVPFDFVVFLKAGESMTATVNTVAVLNVTTRQIADVNGTLVQPVGFNPQ